MILSCNKFLHNTILKYVVIFLDLVVAIPLKIGWTSLVNEIYNHYYSRSVIYGVKVTWN